MITILCKSTKSCFLCQTTEKTADVKFKDGSFAGTLCMNHLYERLEEKPKARKTIEAQDQPEQ